MNMPTPLRLLTLTGYISQSTELIWYIFSPHELRYSTLWVSTKSDKGKGSFSASAPGVFIRQIMVCPTPFIQLNYWLHTRLESTNSPAWKGGYLWNISLYSKHVGVTSDNIDRIISRIMAKRDSLPWLPCAYCEKASFLATRPTQYCYICTHWRNARYLQDMCDNEDPTLILQS